MIALLVLDLAIWAQHLASHKVPLFWRLHQVHHADRDIDVTTAVRFHPIEIALSMLWKIAVVVPLGAAPLRGVPVRGDPQRLRHVQPRQYRASRVARRTLRLSSSRPTCIACITRCSGASTIRITASISRCGTGCSAPISPQPEAGHQGMTIGLTPYQSEAPTRFGWSLGCRSASRKRGSRSEEAHGEIAQEQLFIAARGVHLLERVIEDLDELAVALLHGDAHALAEIFRRRDRARRETRSSLRWSRR